MYILQKQKHKNKTEGKLYFSNLLSKNQNLGQLSMHIISATTIQVKTHCVYHN